MGSIGLPCERPRAGPGVPGLIAGWLLCCAAAQAGLAAPYGAPRSLPPKPMAAAAAACGPPAAPAAPAAWDGGCDGGGGAPGLP